MELKSITVTNWKSITHTKILYKNLLIFIGANNSGKSALMSALIFFVNPVNFTKDYLNNPNLPFRISLEFISDNNILTELIIEKEINNDILIFKINSTGTEEIITHEEYLNILGNLTILEISTYSKVPRDSASLFIKKLIHYLEVNYSHIDISHDFLKEKKLNLENTHINKSSSRHVIFETIKYFNNFLQNNNIETVNKIFIFLENPEIFLNPQEEREYYDILIKLSNLGVYIVIETHSSRFVGLKQYPSITIAQLQRNQSDFFQFKGKLFSGDEIKNFNMNYWINTDRGELFFAKKVILVEGQTDKMVLSYIAKLLKIFKYDYTIVECGSKSLIPQFSKLCNSFRIPYVAVYDKDNHSWRTEVEIENSNHKNKQIQSGIDYRIGKYIEFSNDIEEEMYASNRERKSYRNKPFNALKTVMEEDFKLTPNLEHKIRKIWE
ncbi:MAG: ATP-dependent nuclease [Fusobacteriaceae bacterium]